MADRERTVLQERGEVYYSRPTLAEIIEDCEALGLDPRTVALSSVSVLVHDRVIERLAASAQLNHEAGRPSV
jgi:hypothetical protein